MNSKVIIAFALVVIFATVSYGQPPVETLTNDVTATLNGSGGGVTAGLRHRRQFPYGGGFGGGFGGSNSFANANAGSSNFGAPGFGFGGGSSFANANAGSSTFGGK